MGQIIQYFRQPEAVPGEFKLLAIGEAARKYDFRAARKLTHPNTVIEGIGNLIKSCLGGGIVGIHASYKVTGLWSAAGLNIVLGCFVTHMMCVLAGSAQLIYGRIRVPILSYPDLAEATFAISSINCVRKFSKTMRYLVDITIMLDLFGSCCLYQMLIASQVAQLIKIYYGKDVDERILLASLLLPCIALCMILTLKHLAWCSIVADVVLLLIAACTVYYGSQSASKANRSPMDMPVFKDISGLFSYVGAVVFSMEGVGVTLPIENNLDEPKKMQLVLQLGMAVVVSIVFIVGTFGYWGFGEDSDSPVTKNYPEGEFVALALKFMLPMMIYVTFALNFWVPFNLLWVYFKDRYPNSPKLAERVYRGFIVFIITAIAIVFPSINAFMSVIGTFCLSNMGFLYPAAIELLLNYDDPGLGACKWRLWKFILITIFSLVIMIYGTINNVILLLQDVFGI